MNRENLQDFIRNRNQVLRTGDINRLRAFMQERNMPTPRSNTAMAVLLHKTITVSTLPRSIKMKSQEWLKARGYEPILADDDIK